VAGEVTNWKGAEVPRVLPGLLFDEAAHKYTLNGRPLKGVTNYTSLLRDHSFVQPVDLAWGTARHDHLFHLDMGTLDYSKIDPSMEPYIKGWQWVLESNGWSTDKMLAEQTVYSIKYWLAGRFDRLFETDRYDWLVDFKSGAPDVVTGYQLAAYGMMAIEHKWTTATRLKLVEVCIDQAGHVKQQSFDYKKKLQLFLGYYSIRNDMDK
jgi:hypothetical protein